MHSAKVHPQINEAVRLRILPHQHELDERRVLIGCRRPGGRVLRAAGGGARPGEFGGVAGVLNGEAEGTPARDELSLVGQGQLAHHSPLNL